MMLRSKAKSLALAALVAGVFSVSAHAQYTGPAGESVAQSVQAILDKPVDEQAVRMEGYLVRKLGHEKYAFSDGKTEIVAEIDDDDLPKEAFDDKTRVEIVGEVDTGRNRPPEIEVRTVRIIR